MAVIPQFSAGGPAQARGPVLETQGTVRVDPRGALAAVGNVIEAVQGAAVQNPQLSPMFGQGKARGLQALGQGVQRLGTVFQSIALEEAEARNDAAIFEAQQEMARVYGEFQEWTANAGAMESDRWGDEWQSRLDGWKSSYLQGRKLSPVAQEAIDRSLVRFGTETLINTRVRSAQDAFRRAKGAAVAAWSMAVEAGDPETANAITAGASGRYLHPDEAAMMDYEAAQKIRERQLSDARLRAETALMRGDVAAGKAELEAAPWENPDEKAFTLAKYETKGAAEAVARTYRERWDSGEDPRAILGELEARNEDGTFKNGAEMSPIQRRELTDAMYRELNAERAETVKGLADEIKNGVPLRVIETSVVFRSLPDAQKAELSRLAVEGAKNDVSDYLAALRSAQSYDPTKDSMGDELAGMKEQAALRFSGERFDAVVNALEQAANRMAPQSATERVMNDYFSNLQKRYDAGELGGFRVTGSDISKRKDANGIEVYTVPDPEGKAFPGLLGTYKGRVIQLSEEDRLRYESGKTGSGDVYEDAAAKEAAFSRFLTVQQELESKIKAGELTSADEIQAEGNRLLGGELEKALESRIMDRSGQELPGNAFGGPSNVLFPPNPEADLEWLNSLSLPAQATF